MSTDVIHTDVSKSEFFLLKLAACVGGCNSYAQVKIKYAMKTQHLLSKIQWTFADCNRKDPPFHRDETPSIVAQLCGLLVGSKHMWQST